MSRRQDLYEGALPYRFRAEEEPTDVTKDTIGQVWVRYGPAVPQDVLDIWDQSASEKIRDGVGADEVVCTYGSPVTTRVVIVEEIKVVDERSL